MRAMPSLILIVAFALPGQSRSPIQLANHPSLSPDGRTVAFDWNGDIWTVPAEGGEARRLTNHPARDTHPVFSTDGKSIAFQSDREGGACVHIMDAGGGDARQVTFNTAGTVPLQFTAGGSKLLVEVTRDHNWKHANRLALVDISRRAAEDIVFDEAAEAGRISLMATGSFMSARGPSGGARATMGRRPGRSGSTTAPRGRTRACWTIPP